MRVIAGLLLGFMISLTTAFADEAADKADIRQVIEGQMQAFKADDGAMAYSYATPRLQQIFPSVDVFMSMVKSGYQPVYRPQSVAYGRLKAIPGGYAQEVFIVGPDGESYTALYTLERQPDGMWRISGCRILKADATAA